MGDKNREAHEASLWVFCGIGSLLGFLFLECAVFLKLLLEVALQHAFQSLAVASLITENHLFSRFFAFSTRINTKSEKLMQKNYSLSESLFVI